MSFSTESNLRICIMRNPRSILQISEAKRTTNLLTLAVSKDPTLLGPLEETTLPPDIRIAAIKTNPSVITLLLNPSVNEQLTAVRRDGMLLGSIAHPTTPVQLAAVQQNPAAIQFVHNPTDEMLRKAITANGKVLYYLANPSEDLIDFALSITGLNIRYISPLIETKAMLLKALDSPQRDDVIRYFNEVHGGLFWFGRHFEQAIDDATALGLNLSEINKLIYATLRNKELEYLDTKLVNPWAEAKGSIIQHQNLRMGINTLTGCLELNGFPVRDFFNTIQGMQCNKQEYDLFQCKCRLEAQVAF